MIFVTLNESAEAGELLLVQDGLLRFHRRRDGVVVIREILVLPFRRRTGLGKQLVALVSQRNPGRTLRARCPAASLANGFWAHLDFKLIEETEDVKTWERPRLIYCADGNAVFASAAVEAGWLYGARLPATVYQPVHFADQDWKAPDRTAYMRALAIHCPAMATVLDWEYDAQLLKVLDWAEEAAQHVTDAVVLIPKVVGKIDRLPRQINGKQVILGYSIPTTYGGSPVPLWEHAGWPIHLLGGSPQEQMRLWYQFSLICEVVSADGNMAGQQARRGRTWRRQTGSKGHWWQLRDLGDCRSEGVPLECFRRSLIEIRHTWENLP